MIAEFTPILSFITSLLITAYAIPIIIRAALSRNFYDRPGGRKTHNGNIPHLGGIAIFAGFLISMVCWADFELSNYIKFFVLGLVVLLFIGLKDDIVPMAPLKKLIGQVIGASILVIPGKFEIANLQGVFGIYHLSTPVSWVLSIFAVIVIINSFNLIDGIDGLAGGIALIVVAAYSIVFLIKGLNNMFIASMALTGALISFLYYNTSPAKIFMGDTGSMTIGYLVAAFTLKFLNCNIDLVHSTFNPNPAIIVAILIIPLFDTLRVFTLRIARGRSPFLADRTHIHHVLLDLGCSHLQASIILYGVNILFIALGYYIKDMDPTISLMIIVGLAWGASYIPVSLLRFQKRKYAYSKLQESAKLTKSLSEVPVSIEKKVIKSDVLI